MVRWEWKQSPELLHLEKQKNLSTRSYPLRGFPSALKWLWLGSIAATFKLYCRICSVNFDADIGWLWPSQRKGGFNRALRFYLWGAIWFSWSWNRRWKSRFKLARSICKTPEIINDHQVFYKIYQTISLYHYILYTIYQVFYKIYQTISLYHYILYTRSSIRYTRLYVQEQTLTTSTRRSARRRRSPLPSWSSFWTRSSEMRGSTRFSTRSTTKRGWPLTSVATIFI